nr:GTPase HflX [Candidatus Cloacimonadota bacterium]
MQKIKDRVFLVGVFWGKISREHYNESLEELYRLAKTAEVEVVDSFVQSLKKPDTATYIGKGKLQEIKNTAENMKVRTIIFNNKLSPSQSRNISDITGCNVVDRTELILDIFAKHARTRQAKLQVELAQLEYAYTKLKRMWKHLSRIQGGIGFRGPGETQIEVDRRLIRKRTSILKKKLKTIESISITKRKRRKDIISIALVGYTNAGKSTLFNRLTKENRYTANQLFATLDSKTRSLHIDQSEMMMITDTIGFIRQLPHKLVTSFHSTLLEVIEADLLLHVVEVSRTNILELMDSVSSVLEEIGAADKNILVVFNKTDLVG